MSVFEYIREKRKNGPLHFTLIDPDKQDVEKGIALAQYAKSCGTDAIMIGGSQPSVLITLEQLTKGIKNEVGLPVILFPYSHSALVKSVDAIFFMSLLNCRTPQYLIEEQMRGAVMIKNYGIETLPMGYLIIESGKTTSAAFGADAKPVPRDKPEFAVAYALAAKYFGMKFVYLEAGSGAEFSVPKEMVSLVKQAIGSDVFLIVGGGIRTPEDAREKIEAGADIVVTGTIAEQNKNILKSIIMSIKEKII